jgi:uncharacterized RDD family membrane protein YckC
MKPEENQSASTPVLTSPASFGRRLGAFVYDALLLFAVLMLAGALFMLVNGGQPTSFWSRLCYQLYLLLVSFLYFAGFWVRGGQTVGMLAWQLRVVSPDGATIGWDRASKRFAIGILSLLCGGVGFLWALFDKEGRAWHDRFSNTRLIRITSVRSQQNRPS